MEHARLDRLARALGGVMDRRAGLGAILAGAAAALGGGTSADAAPNEEQCLPDGQRCGRGSGKNGKPCRKCCSRYVLTQANGRKRCGCKPDGVQCSNSSQCCTGICADGTCVTDRPPGDSGITPALLGLVLPVAAPGYRLQMMELVWEPGAYSTSHFHPLAQVACVQSGALGMSFQEGMTILFRGGQPDSAKPVPVGGTVVLRARDCVAYDEFAAHAVHTVWNASNGKTVLWMADLVKLGEDYTTYVDENGDPIP